MKKIGNFIRNLYRITLMKPTGAKLDRTIILDRQDSIYLIISKLIKSDPETLEPDPEILSALEKRVASKRRPVAGNSIAGIFLPFFTLKNIELKMALISIVLVISLGINPSANFQVNREISPFSLADTLIDSSKLQNPVYDVIKERR
jgi:hypothetical protein